MSRDETAVHIPARPVYGLYSPIHHLARTPACRGGVGEVLPGFAAKRASDDPDLGTARFNHTYTRSGAEYQANPSARETATLPGASASAGIQPPVRQSEGQQSTDTEAALLRLGKVQIEDLFAHNDRNPLDDSEFIPLLDTLIESFARAGLSALAVKNLRRHACGVYHRYCQEAAPESTFEANLELMFRCLRGSNRTLWLRSM